MSSQTASNLPIPDPTVLTTEQLRRELAGLREIVETRLAGMDHAATLLNENVTRVPTEVDRQIAHLKELFEEKMSKMDEKFVGVQKQFDERDVRASASESAANTAVNAALQAQKEAAAAQNESNTAAISKSEKTTEKQFDGINALLNSNSNSLNDKIAAINSRLDREDGTASGGATKQATLFIIGGLVISAIMLIIGVYTVMHVQPQMTQPQIVVQPPTSISSPTTAPTTPAPPR